MSSIKIKQLLFLIFAATIIATSISCNKKEEEETEIAVTPATVAIKKFSIAKNDSVMEKLDSVAFSIDLNTGVIFNADSLPKGTDVTRLIPSITFANTMSKAEISFLKDDTEQVTVNYLTNSTDSIDFTYPVTLDVTAEDGINSFSYQIRVNVHKVDPDTLMWTQMSYSSLPSRYENPLSQKSVFQNATAISLIEENNGEYTLATCSDLNLGEWEKQSLKLEFEPLISSFTASDEKLYILSRTNELLESDDGSFWTSVDSGWVSILGNYGFSVLGIKEVQDTLFHSMYPSSEGFEETPLESGFPVSDFSPLGRSENSYSSQPVAFILGGITEEGNISSAVWAYDGETWAIINGTSLPGLYCPMMARYVAFRDTPVLFTQRELDIWILFGGLTEDGEMNRVVYMSYDNGVNWLKAPDSMQLPEFIPSLEGSDLIVAGYYLSADLAEAWTPKELTRTIYDIDGFEINWLCPYLYIFGGYDSQGTLSTEIWRGVIARLVFVPSI